LSNTDICIIGAGPGGCATALKLNSLGISCTLVDKASFPRDKVCGDAISGKSVTILRRIDPGIVERFEAATDEQCGVWGIRFGAPNGTLVDVPFRPGYDPAADPAPGFVSKRLDFDRRLVDEVRRCPLVRFAEDTHIETYERTARGYRIGSADGTFSAEARLLIVANGAHSAFSRHHAGLHKDDRHHAGAVRAYYRGVEGLHPDGFIELHFLKEISPGYFWIFGLPGGHANVGLGMRSDYVRRRRYNLTKGMLDIVAQHPLFRERFRNAELLGKPLGYGLPLGSKQRPLSGDHYMLVGDAAHLIDPLSGEGIGNAIYSGSIAAEQVQQCLALGGDFAKETLRAYDVRVARVLGSEMRISHGIQQLMARPWLVNFVADRVARNPRLLYLIAEMYTDMDLRRRALNPAFWVRNLFGTGR
jgi:geranylgeranyl reductase family protein